MLTTQAAIESRLQIVFDADPDPVIADLIAAAQAHIEGYVGRPLESAEYVELYDGHTPQIMLEHWPVTDVTAVSVDGTPLVVADEVRFWSWGRLMRRGLDGAAEGFPQMWGSLQMQPVSVTYEAGYQAGTHDSELAHLGSICTEMVARAFRQALDWVERPAGGVQSIALSGSDSVTYATGAGGGQVPAEALGSFLVLTQSDKDELAGYRSPAVA